MARPWRTFVGLRVHGALAARLHEAGTALAADDPVLRVPAREDLHLTLQFLGPTAPEVVPQLGEALARAAHTVPLLDLIFEGLGAFPNVQRPRIVWAAAVDPSREHLRRLVRRIGRELAPLGYPPERRPFHPHVTLARVRARPRPQTLQALIEGAGTAFGRQTLSEVSLIVSRPGESPYHYRNLTTIELSNEGPAPM